MPSATVAAEPVQLEIVAGDASGPFRSPSLQNARPGRVRRVVAVLISAGATLGAALVSNISTYENSLTLLGSVSIPLSADLIVDFLLLGPVGSNLSTGSRARVPMLVAWAVGVVVYQLINPGYIAWWESTWQGIGRAIGFAPAAWMPASVLSFAALGAAACDLVPVARAGGGGA